MARGQHPNNMLRRRFIHSLGRRRAFSVVIAMCGSIALAGAGILLAQSPQPAPGGQEHPVKTFVGFDRNDYPGDAALAELKKSFAFTGFWLSPPPGEKSNSWHGKRSQVSDAGFGFLLLFNGKLEKELPSRLEAQRLGKIDGARAVESAVDEDFAKGATIFLDQEEGGRLSPVQLAYILAWADGVSAAGYHSGIYCSGVPAREAKGVSVITALNLKSRAGSRDLAFFVFNDVCPPSPGCRIPQRLPSVAAASGVKFAEVWQYAQTPREKSRTVHCTATYAKDGNCYSPGMQSSGIYVDLNFATSPDPSHARK
jgi:hypothetical protein